MFSLSSKLYSIRFDLNAGNLVETLDDGRGVESKMRVLVSNIVLAEDIVRVLVAAEVLARGALLERMRERGRERESCI